LDYAGNGRLVKINNESSTPLTPSSNLKTRVIMWYNWDTVESTSSVVNIDAVDPTDVSLVGKKYVILGDLTFSGSNITKIDYTYRDYSAINEDFINFYMPSNIGIRWSPNFTGNTHIQLVYNKQICTSKYRLESLVSGGTVTKDGSVFYPNGTAWKSVINTGTSYYVFLCLEIDETVTVRIYSSADAGWDGSKFVGLNKDFPFHKFIGQFVTGGSISPVIEILSNSFYDSFLDCPRGDIRMFSGVSVPLGWTICDGINGSPNLKSKFIVGADLISSQYSSNTFTISANTVTLPGAGLLVWMQDNNLNTLVGKKLKEGVGPIHVWEIMAESGQSIGANGIIQTAPTSLTIRNETKSSSGTTIYFHEGVNQTLKIDTFTPSVRLSGGESFHQLTEAELASHTHPVNAELLTNMATGGGFTIRDLTSPSSNDGSTVHVGNDNPFDNRPSYYSLYYAIKI
jgi:microcystin-dependent protein